MFNLESIVLLILTQEENSVDNILSMISLKSGVLLILTQEEDIADNIQSMISSHKHIITWYGVCSW